MADEPEVVVQEPEVEEAEPAPAEAEDVTVDAEADEPEADTEDDGEEADEDDDRPLTRAERKQLEELKARDEQHAVALEQERQRARFEGEQAARAQAIAQQQQQKLTDFQARWTAYQTDKAQRSAELKAYRRQDPIDGQELEEQYDRYWTEQEAAFTREYQELTAQQSAGQYEAKIRSDTLRAVLATYVPEILMKLVPEEVRAVRLQDKNPNFEQGLIEHWQKLVPDLIEHGRKLGRAEMSADREKERKQMRAELGLQEEAPDIGTGGRAQQSRIPSPDQWDRLTWEQRTEWRTRDPRIDDKIVANSARRRR